MNATSGMNGAYSQGTPAVSSFLGVQSAQGFSAQAVSSDKVTFSSQKPDERQLLKATNQEAVTIFSQNQTKDQLVKAMQDAFQGTAYHLEIYDGSQPGQEWVNDVCSTYGNVAFFQVPDAVLYGASTMPPNLQPAENQPDNDGFPPLYINVILPNMETKTADGKQRVAVYLSNRADMGTLRHEFYHALQFKNGLSFGTTPQADEKAFSFRNAFNQNLLTVPQSGVLKPVVRFINSVWRMAKGLFSWAVEVPFIQLKRLLGEKAQQPNQTPTSGESLRVNMAREREVDAFFLKFGGTCGFPLNQRLAHALHYLFESKLQDLRSYKLD